MPKAEAGTTASRLPCSWLRWGALPCHPHGDTPSCQSQPVRSHCHA